MFKKILCSVISLGIILCLPVFSSAEVTADTYKAYVDIQRYYYMVDVSSNVIEDEYTFYVNNGDAIPITNNMISNKYQYPNAYGYEAIILAFEFPESKYVAGQSYQLRFDVSESKNYIYTYFFPNAIPLGFTSKYFEEGDEYYPYKLNTSLLSSLNDTQKNGMLTQAYSGTNEVVFDITVPEDYSVGLVSEKSARTILVYMYATYWANNNATIFNTTYSNIRLIPTGSTQYLYSDKVFQENVEIELSDLNNSISDIQSGLMGPGTYYDPAIDNKNDINNILENEADLNKDFSGDLQNQFNIADDVFTNNSAFSFISNTFSDMLLSNSSINSLIIFALAIGLCVLVLGRRLNA